MRGIIAGVLVVGLAWSAGAQSGDDPSFIAASIKPISSDQGHRFSILPGRLIAWSVSLQTLLYQAYRIQPSRIVGLPEWARSEEYDITAVAPEGSGANSRQILAMVRTLLRTRFALRAHVEARDLPLYRLQWANADHKRGPRLRPATINCGDHMPGVSEVPEANAGVACNIQGGASTLPNGLTFDLKGRSIDHLAADLEVLTARPVRNDVDLPGLFDITLEYSNGRGADANADALTVFTAIREQLGFKLEPARGPVDVLVVDAVQHPTAD
jgi:uncharacterized protein (TIGR03435 family)